MAKQIKTIFVRDTLPHEAPKDKGHKTGDVVELNEDAHARWVRRGAAREATAEDLKKNDSQGKGSGEGSGGK